MVYLVFAQNILSFFTEPISRVHEELVSIWKIFCDARRGTIGCDAWSSTKICHASGKHDGVRDKGFGRVLPFNLHATYCVSM